MRIVGGFAGERTRAGEQVEDAGALDRVVIGMRQDVEYRLAGSARAARAGASPAGAAVVPAAAAAAVRSVVEP
jgi:hypothetical protein